MLSVSKIKYSALLLGSLKNSKIKTLLLAVPRRLFCFGSMVILDVLDVMCRFFFVFFFFILVIYKYRNR